MEIANGLAVRNRQQDHREVLLASMRVASLNLRSWQAELDLIGVALSREEITVPTAIDWLDEMGVLRWLPDTPQIDGERVPA